MQKTSFNLDCLSALLERQGQWLLQQQPRHLQRDFAETRALFDRVSGHVQVQLHAELLQLFPEIPFSLAEFDPSQQLQPECSAYWICDALDGAVQYLAGLPLWTLTLCLIVDTKPLLALVYYPAGGCMYRAMAGQGADCNGSVLRVAERSQLELAMLATSFPNYPQRPQLEIDDFLAKLACLIPRVFAQRWMGPASLSLSQLAAGVFDGYWETGRSLYDWLPGALIAQEAGAQLTGLDGRPFDWNCQGILAASPAIYPELAAVFLNP
jgi:myo-inositol-1(or 4)-monophosphatase